MEFGQPMLIDGKLPAAISQYCGLLTVTESNAPTGPGSLTGVRVVDLAHFVAGPAATMGAEVIKVERPDVESSQAPLNRLVISVRHAGRASLRWLAELHRRAGGPPVKPGPDLADNGTGLMTAMGIIAAPYQRQHTGRGQHIQVAMTDHVSTFIRIHYGYPIEENVATPRPGNWVPFTRRVAPA